jgi:hypothetical protein
MVRRSGRRKERGSILLCAVRVSFGVVRSGCWGLDLVMRFRWWNYMPRNARALISGLPSANALVRSLCLCSIFLVLIDQVCLVRL